MADSSALYAAGVDSGAWKLGVEWRIEKRSLVDVSLYLNETAPKPEG